MTFGGEHMPTLEAETGPGAGQVNSCSSQRFDGKLSQ